MFLTKVRIHGGRGHNQPAAMGANLRWQNGKVERFIRPRSGWCIISYMITHRYHFPHYQQVAFYFWPILFFELWRVDLWQEETGRLAFVIPDKYGRAWVKYFEGM
ncbi:MAG: hypothetical protein AAGL99_17750, partial [Pseudomonadota bacterium]